MANVEINVLANVGQAQAGFKALEQTMTNNGKAVENWNLKLGSASDFLSGLGVALPTNPMQAFGQALAFSIGEASEAEQVLAQTNAVIRSTGGAAGMTADEITDLASALQSSSRFSDEAIQKGENLLLTFTNIGEDVFPDATRAMVDMAAALGTDVSGGAVQLGKALNDPIAGISALSRVGVSFTADQKEMIRSMVEMGDVAGAQTLILAELNKEFGGSAQAQADTYAGKIDQAKNAFSDLGEMVGGAVLPPLGDYVSQITEGARFVGNFTAALEKGTVGWGDYARMAGEVIFTDKTLAQVNDELTSGVTEQARPVEAATARWTELADSYTTATDATWDNSAALEANAARWQGMADAFEASKVAQELDDAAAAASRFNMILAGAVGNEMASYTQSQDDLEAQIAETRAELEKYTALSGQTVTVITDTDEAQRNLTIAMAAQETAAGTLAAAQQKLSENTDPDKQLQLEAALARAQGALVNAQGEVGEWNSTLAESGGTYVTDYTTKINEITGELYTLEEAAAANAAAHELATEKILFGYIQQALAVDGLSLDEIHALTAIGEQWGLLDDGTTTAVDGVLDAVTKLNDDGSLAEFQNDVNGVRDAILGVPTDITTTFHVNVDGQTPSYTGPHGGNANAFAEGGEYGRGVRLVGEEGPELDWASGNGVITTASDSADLVSSLHAIAQALTSGMGRQGNTYVVNGTYANQDGGTVAQELRLMGQLYG